MIPFELAEPRSLHEAAALIDAEDPSVRAIAGGTALMLMMKTGVFQPARLVSLRGVEPCYSKIAAVDGGLRLGALTTLSALARSSVVKAAAPVIAQTLKTLSNVRVRNVATLGGHLAHGDPHMDLPPVMIALGAQVVTVAPTGSRTLAVADLYTGYYETSLARNELIAEVVVPVPSGRRTAYIKCTTRAADDWPTLGIAVSLAMESGVVKEARIVVSAATEMPVRLSAAEKILQGASVSDAVLKNCGEAAANETEMVADARGSASYKQALLRVYVGRAIRAALAA
ncbi:MAG: xanthine dehydrogenase family protein subunit M [Burkholderiales bacterium]